MTPTRPAYETTGQRLSRYALWCFAGMVLFFLIAPIGVIVPLSFSAGSFLHFPLPGLSLRWYEDFFSSELWLPALKNSLIVGTGAALIATTLGTLAAFGFWRARFPLRRLLFGVLLAPLVVPVVIVAVGVYFSFAKFGLVDGYFGLMLAHAALGAPFVLVTVLSTLAGFIATCSTRRRAWVRRHGWHSGRWRCRSSFPAYSRAHCSRSRRRSTRWLWRCC